MKKTLAVVVLTLAALTGTALGQTSTFQDSLLDRMIGAWILQGTIGGQETTHDVVAEWVVGHQYLSFHEISRDQDSRGMPLYEAIVFIGWDQPSGQYACLWLDSTGGGGLKGQAIGYAKRAGDEICFLFKPGDGSLFHTTFVYDRGTDTWKWLMDGEAGGKRQPFARVTLTRKR